MLGLLFALGSLPRADAAEPPAQTFARTPAGGWQTVLAFPAPEADVRAALADPIAAARFSPDISAVTYLERGVCSTLRAVTSGFASVSYVYRRCPTADGWHETLVSSDDLDAYEVRWGFAPRGTSTVVTYMVRIDPHLPAPDFLLARQMRSSISRIVSGLYRAVTAGMDARPTGAGDTVSGGR